MREGFMDGSWRFPTRFLSWPYYGSGLDDEQEAHEALEAAAASLLSEGNGLQDGTPPRRRSRRIRDSQAEGD
jgi:hypothetical protein